MHPRAAQLIRSTLLRVEARLAQQALGLDQVPPVPVVQEEPPESTKLPDLAKLIARSDLDEVPAQPPLQLLPPLARRVAEMAMRGWTPQMVAHELRLHPKRVRQVARDHFIVFHRQRQGDS